MKNLKQQNKEQLEIERLKLIVKQLEFSNISECTDYYYNEFGKLKIVSPKLNSKKFYKKIYKILNESFLLNLSCVALAKKSTVGKIKHQLKNKSSEVARPQTTQPTTPQLPANETKLLNNTQGENKWK